MSDDSMKIQIHCVDVRTFRDFVQRGNRHCAHSAPMTHGKVLARKCNNQHCLVIAMQNGMEPLLQGDVTRVKQ
eukprot:11215772-Lingulodinium_polyedra.AAC.1